MHIYLPVHQSPGDDKLLHAIDTLLVHHQLVVVHIEHRDDAVGAHDALAHTGEERVAAQVVEAVHIELATDELVQEMLMVSVGEYLNGDIQCATHLLVHPFHHHKGNLLMRHVD